MMTISEERDRQRVATAELRAAPASSRLDATATRRQIAGQRLEREEAPRGTRSRGASATSRAVEVVTTMRIAAASSARIGGEEQRPRRRRPATRWPRPGNMASRRPGGSAGTVGRRGGRRLRRVGRTAQGAASPAGRSRSGGRRVTQPAGRPGPCPAVSSPTAPLASGQAVRRLTLDQEIEGSNPSSPASYPTGSGPGDSRPPHLVVSCGRAWRGLQEGAARCREVHLIRRGEAGFGAVVIAPTN